MKKIILFLALSLFVFGCKKVDDTSYSVNTTTELAQQVGDAMASVDESGGSNLGAISQFEMTSYEKSFARLTHGEPINKTAILKLALPDANAATCSSTTFTACSGSQRVRTFGDCTVGLGGTISGNVTLNFTGTGAGTCTIPSASDYVSRVPNYTITGLRGATFSVTATGSGQTMTRLNATQFTFSNSGIKRKFTTPSGTTLLDLTTTTTGTVTITGTSRNTRTMTSGGASEGIVLVNNLTSVSCTLAPTSITWGNTCNCPTNGQWNGNCTDGATFVIAFGSTCGQTTVTRNGTEVSTVTMDRCQ